MASRVGRTLTPPSGPNISALGNCTWPAYLAPVNPASGLFPVPAARFTGTPGLFAASAFAEPPEAAPLCALEAAPLTM